MKTEDERARAAYGWAQLAMRELAQSAQMAFPGDPAASAAALLIVGSTLLGVSDATVGRGRDVTEKIDALRSITFAECLKREDSRP